MQRFNIALLPTDTALQTALAGIAQTHFAASQNGYILANGALAHVTLCQFDAEGEQEARDSVQSLHYKNNEELLIKKFHYRTGVGEHSGFLWAEYLVEKKPSLLEMQKRCALHIAQRGHTTFTSIKYYSPHITLARVKHEVLLSSLEPFVPNQRVTFRPVLGISTENGLLIREL